MFDNQISIQIHTESICGFSDKVHSINGESCLNPISLVKLLGDVSSNDYKWFKKDIYRMCQ